MSEQSLKLGQCEACAEIEMPHNKCLHAVQAEQPNTRATGQAEESGDNEPCKICGKPCDEFTANPSAWPIRLPVVGGNGESFWNHMGCVVEQIHKAQSANEEIERLKKQAESLIKGSFGASQAMAAENADLRTKLQGAEKVIEQCAQSIKSTMETLPCRFRNFGCECPHCLAHSRCEESLETIKAWREK